MKVAVISGDIINSGKLPVKQREVLYKKLEAFLKKLGKKGEYFKGETNQGDWFQCLVDHPQEALRYALIIKTYLKSFHESELVIAKIPKGKKVEASISIDARISLGIGNVDFIGARLGSSDGEAFRISGRLLDKIKKTNHSLIGGVDKEEKLNGELENLLVMLDLILSKTTSLQCQVIMRKLLGKKETEIAKELHILQSAVNQRSTAAGWNAIESAVNRFETIITNE
jgi:hypothetical protein